MLVMTRETVHMVCEHCGSQEVTRDAWAEWDVDSQRWILGTVFDYAFCHLCKSGATIEVTLQTTNES